MRLAVPVLATALAASAVPASAAASGLPSATTWSKAPAVAAVFAGGSASGTHGCSAAVVDSWTHDTVLTAAHCIAGTGAGVAIVPGYRGGAAPYGVWTVTKTYVDPAWRSSQNPAYDVAVVKVAKRYVNGAWRGIQDVTGAYTLGGAPANGSPAVLGGYNAGRGDLPIRCATVVHYTRGYPTIDCNGFYGGTSGSPFLQTVGRTTYVTGVLGGLHQGGCVPWTSYASPFGRSVATLLRRAATNQPGDYLPAPGSDGC